LAAPAIYYHDIMYLPTIKKKKIKNAVSVSYNEQ